MADKSPDMSAVPSPGQLFRHIRRENGLAIEDVADHLLLSVAQVKALEMDDYEKLPGATYIMGYWRSYAGLLKIDASKSIDQHKAHLDYTTPAIALERDHQRAHGHQEKSRKKSALLFFLLSALFLSGIWYWQNPDDNPVNQWVENLSKRQLTVRNSSTETSDSQNFEEDTAEDTVFEFIPEQGKQAIITLPEPNFSGEFENGKQEVLLSSGNDPVINPVSSQGKLQQFSVTTDSVSVQNAVSPEPGDIVAVETVESIEIVSEVITANETENVNDGISQSTIVAPEIDQPESMETEQISAPDASTQVSGSIDSVSPVVEETVDNPVEVAVADTPGVDNSLSETASAGDSESSDGAVAEPVINAENFDADSPRWISFNVKKQTWLDVRDSNADKLIYRTANVGESIQLNGKPPFYIFIGTVDGVGLEYLGKQVEFEADENSEFSRFALGEFE